MSRLAVLYRGTVGKKALVAVTGFVLLGFLLGHMAGNLKAFVPDPQPGVADIDVYAAYLREIGVPLLPHGWFLWLTRAGLFSALVVHVVCVVQLAARNRAARPVGYRVTTQVEATRSARAMLVTGSLLLLFVVLHLLHLTVGNLDPANFEHGEVYQNLYLAFRQPIVVGLYVAASGLVAAHLFHGTWSFFQTLGLDSPDRNLMLRRAAAAVALLLFFGFAAVPAGFLTGALGPPDAGTPMAQLESE